MSGHMSSHMSGHTSGHMFGHTSGHMFGHMTVHMSGHMTVLSLQGTCTEQVGQDTISRIWTAIVTLDVNTIREYIDTSFIQVGKSLGTKLVCWLHTCSLPTKI